MKRVSISWSMHTGNLVEAKSGGCWIQKAGRGGIGSEVMGVMTSLVVR